jgi:hypothetical protein
MCAYSPLPVHASPTHVHRITSAWEGSNAMRRLLSSTLKPFFPHSKSSPPPRHINGLAAPCSLAYLHNQWLMGTEVWRSGLSYTCARSAEPSWLMSSSPSSEALQSTVRGASTMQRPDHAAVHALCHGMTAAPMHRGLQRHRTPLLRMSETTAQQRLAMGTPQPRHAPQSPLSDTHIHTHIHLLSSQPACARAA